MKGYQARRVRPGATFATVAIGGWAILSGNAVNREQQEVTYEGQITDRFTAAIEHVGSDNMSLRLGGIYALERIMKDSSADEPAIIEVLCSFVRQFANLHGPAQVPSPALTPTWTFGITPDVQAALTVLGRRPNPDLAANRNIDLRFTDLTGANLDGANLYGANLTALALALVVGP